MARYKRKFDCGVCGGTVYYDSETEILICKCGEGVAQITNENLSEFFTEIQKVIIEAPFGKNTRIDYMRGDQK